MIATAQTDARAAAKERFCTAALWWMADQSCSTALAELEDAYEAYREALRDAVDETLRRARRAA